MSPSMRWNAPAVPAQCGFSQKYPNRTGGANPDDANRSRESAVKALRKIEWLGSVLVQRSGRTLIPCFANPHQLLLLRPARPGRRAGAYDDHRLSDFLQHLPGYCRRAPAAHPEAVRSRRSPQIHHRPGLLPLDRAAGPHRRALEHLLDLITQSLADLDNPDQPWSKAIITNQGYHLSDLRDPSSASQSAIRRRPAFSVASFNRWPMLNVWPTRALGSNPGHAAAPVLSV